MIDPVGGGWGKGTIVPFKHFGATHMPSPETLERFIARVEQNAHAEAIEEFYAQNSSMRENQSEARVGRELHVANERKVLARRSRCIRSASGPCS